MEGRHFYELNDSICNSHVGMFDLLALILIFQSENDVEIDEKGWTETGGVI